MSLHLVPVFFALAYTCVEVHANSHDPKVTLQQVRDDNRRSIEAIHSLTCHFQIVNSRGGQLINGRSGDYWRSVDDFRIRWQVGEQWCDAFMRDGRLTCFSNSHDLSGKPIISTSISRYDGLPIGECDPFHHSLLTFYGARNGVPTLVLFDELLSSEHKLRKAEVESSTGQVVVEIDFPHGIRSEYRFDPKANYLCSFVQSTSSGTTISLQVDRFKEASPGVFFPERVIHKSYDAEKLTSQKTYEFSKVVANAALGADALNPVFNRDSEVHDLIKGKVYKTDENGRPIGTEVELATAPPPTSDFRMRTETRESPRSWPTWVLAASGICLFLGITLWFIRRRRERLRD
jgi:hypothetical protein